MHPIGNILIFDDCIEYKDRVTKHFQAPLHVKGAPERDEDIDSKVIQFIDQYRPCSLPMNKKYSGWNDLVKTIQSHHHTQTCRKRKGFICRFNAPLPATNERLIIHKIENTDKLKICKSKKFVDKIFSWAIKIDDLGKIAEQELLDIAECQKQNIMRHWKMRKTRPLYYVNVGRFR